MLRQYHAAKSEHPGAILMFRMGDFYEMFFEDALAASRTLGITLTARGKGTPNEAPMCGIPYHAADSYVTRLVRAGFRVALCDQVEEPVKGKKLVRREVVRIVTPGTLMDPAQLDARAPAWIASVFPAGTGLAGIAFADLTTGDFRLLEANPATDGASRADLVEAIESYTPQEIIHPEGVPLPPLVSPGTPVPLLTPRPTWSFAARTAHRALCEHLGVANLVGFGCEEREAAVSAAGALLSYLQETQKATLAHLDRLRFVDRSAGLTMDASTRRNLELTRSLADGGTRATLLWTVDRTVTPMGGRLLRDGMLRPLRDLAAIRLRHDAVADLAASDPPRRALRETLRRVGDIERLLSRMAVGSGTPIELAALRSTIEALPDVHRAASECGPPTAAGGGAADGVAAGIEDHSGLAALLGRALAEEPPPGSRDGGVVRDGYDAEVDEARSLARDGRATLAGMESRERERTGISSLKIRYNRVFGYSIEISKSNLKKVPADYERRQTLVGGERYVTAELKDYEAKILTAQERIEEREHAIFLSLRRAVVEAATPLRRTAAAVAALDALAALAETAVESGWVRPEMDEGTRIEIRGGRHPVIEKLLGPGRFVPNDLVLDTAGPQIAIVTGPNMGGKSTYLRQTALMVVLAQMGSFVPAAQARIGLVDRIFSRVGASDNLAGGQSTFLVEMNETANILHNATPHSLVLLDEVGRGTSTFDGLSLAWAVVERLHEAPSVAARTLFATHYHELTELDRALPRVVNLHIAAREHKGEVVFLHEVRSGSADQSYGIQVARLAGIPPEVIDRAREILTNLERNEFGPEGTPRLARRRRREDGQLPLFVPAGEAILPPPADHPALRALRETDPDRLSPLEALNRLAELKRLSEE